MSGCARAHDLGRPLDLLANRHVLPGVEQRPAAPRTCRPGGSATRSARGAATTCRAGGPSTRQPSPRPARPSLSTSSSRVATSRCHQRNGRPVRCLGPADELRPQRPHRPRMRNRHQPRPGRVLRHPAKPLQPRHIPTRIIRREPVPFRLRLRRRRQPHAAGPPSPGYTADAPARYTPAGRVPSTWPRSHGSPGWIGSPQRAHANPAGQHDRHELVPDLPMSAAIAPTDRLRRTHRVVSAGIVLGEKNGDWRGCMGGPKNRGARGQQDGARVAVVIGCRHWSLDGCRLCRLNWRHLPRQAGGRSGRGRGSVAFD